MSLLGAILEFLFVGYTPKAILFLIVVVPIFFFVVFVLAFLVWLTSAPAVGVWPVVHAAFDW